MPHQTLTCQVAKQLSRPPRQAQNQVVSPLQPDHVSHVPGQRHAGPGEHPRQNQPLQLLGQLLGDLDVGGRETYHASIETAHKGLLLHGIHGGKIDGAVRRLSRRQQGTTAQGSPDVHAAGTIFCEKGTPPGKIANGSQVTLQIKRLRRQLEQVRDISIQPRFKCHREMASDPNGFREGAVDREAAAVAAAPAAVNTPPPPTVTGDPFFNLEVVEVMELSYFQQYRIQGTPVEQEVHGPPEKQRQPD